jgi:hypothetical protein
MIPSIWTQMKKNSLMLMAASMQKFRWKDGSKRKFLLKDGSTLRPRLTAGLMQKFRLTAVPMQKTRLPVWSMQKFRLKDVPMHYSDYNFRLHCCDSQYLSCAWNYCNY